MYISLILMNEWMRLRILYITVKPETIQKSNRKRKINYHIEKLNLKINSEKCVNMIPYNRWKTWKKKMKWSQIAIVYKQNTSENKSNSMHVYAAFESVVCMAMSGMTIDLLELRSIKNDSNWKCTQIKIMKGYWTIKCIVSFI